MQTKVLKSQNGPQGQGTPLIFGKDENRTSTFNSYALNPRKQKEKWGLRETERERETKREGVGV